MACLALALDTALVLFQGRQLQTACESAALAGAAELMDPIALTPAGLTHWLATAGGTAFATDHQHALHTAAYARATAYAAANRAGGRPVELQAALDGSAASDVVTGVVYDPTSVDDPLIATSAGPGLRSNSLLVRTSRATERGNPVTLWFGQMLGISDLDLTASARATLDNRVVGLRPAGHVRVPLVPLVVLAGDDGSNEWMRQATEPCQAGKNDRISAHPSRPQIGPGSDGIPEIELTLALDDAHLESCNARLVAISGGAAASADDLRRQLLAGYHQQDLAACGGAVALTSVLPVVPAGAIDSTGIASAVDLVCGQRRVWLLGSETAEGSCLLTGFAAGQSISVVREPGQLRITIQPCQLITCTACTGVAGPANPWIGKLLRSE